MVDVGGGSVFFDSIVVDGGGVVGCEVFWNVMFVFECCKFFDVVFFEGYLKVVVV